MVREQDVVTMKKAHPCGGKQWQVIAVASDIKLRCVTCGRYVNLSRADLKKRMKSVAEQEKSDG